MKSIFLLLIAFPSISVAQINLNYNTDIQNLPFRSVMARPYFAKGDCVTDDSNAIQSALNDQQFVYFPRPPGGCYLISKTLKMSYVNYLYGASANNPTSGTPKTGVIVRLKAGSNVSMIQTPFVAGGTESEYMEMENIVFDGNGQHQTQELRNTALVDFRGALVSSFLKHITITNSFGPALYTVADTLLENIWIIGTTTSTYSWMHNPTAQGYGTVSGEMIFVEDQFRPQNGRFNSGKLGDPTQYAHAILINGAQNMNLKTIHCESALTCIDFAGVQGLTITGISATRLGNPTDADPTNNFLIRMLDFKSEQLTFSNAYFDQEGSNYRGPFRNRVFGLAEGMSTQGDWYQTPIGINIWPFYTHGEFFLNNAGWPYLGERPAAGNELWIQGIGGYSPNSIKIWDNAGAPNGSYYYEQRAGGTVGLGFSPGPLGKNEQNLLQLNYYGTANSGNNVQIPVTLQANGKIIAASGIQTGKATNSDLSGELSITSAKSVAGKLSNHYSNHPECTVTPQFDIGNGNRYWITYPAADSFIVTFASPVSGSISYVCVGRN
jgi:hypothetical protein